MNFSTSALVEQVVWNMRLGDQQRAKNRAQLSRLFNGFPPWTASEADSANIKTNVNFLDAPKLGADARRSYYNAFLKPERFFNVTLQDGPVKSRLKWGQIITQEINRPLKNSLPYFENIKSQMAAVVLYGIGPMNWETRTKWRPRAIGVEDLLVPSGTLVSLENLTHFAIFRQFTVPELQRRITGNYVDKGWNIPLVNRAIEWAMNQDQSQPGYTETLSPEKIQERLKQDGYYYGTDSAPTIDTWDFYFLCEEENQIGWKRRMIIDTPAADEVRGAGKPDKNLIGEKDSSWLYSTEDRIYAKRIDEIIHFQFADLSATSPFRYHSVRSLGWLIYAVCNLQNRLRCKVNDATFENLLQYFRAGTSEDHERLVKLDLHNWGIIPEGIDFVKQGDRWQINHSLVGQTMTDNRNMLNEAAAQFREGRDLVSQKEKTATEIMAEVNSANALVGSMLLLSYIYQDQQYREIARRFCIANSDDIDVVEFRKRCLMRGVPVEYLDESRWAIASEKVLGSGNKMLQIAMADKLMAIFQLLPPHAQREALQLYVMANSDIPELAIRWFPENPNIVTPEAQNAQTMIGSIMQGVTILPAPTDNPGEIVKTLIAGMAEIMKRITATTGVPTMQELAGLTNLSMTIGKYNAALAASSKTAPAAKENAAAIGQLTQMVKKWGNDVRQQQEAEAQAQQGGQNQAGIADAQAKAQAIALGAQTKAKISAAAAAQKMQIENAKARQKMRNDEISHRQNIRQSARESAVQSSLLDLKTAAQIRNDRKKSEAKLKPKPIE